MKVDKLLADRLTYRLLVALEAMGDVSTFFGGYFDLTIWNEVCLRHSALEVQMGRDYVRGFMRFTGFSFLDFGMPPVEEHDWQEALDGR